MFSVSVRFEGITVDWCGIHGFLIGVVFSARFPAPLIMSD